MTIRSETAELLLPVAPEGDAPTLETELDAKPTVTEALRALKGRRGMTLIEIMVVVGIMAIIGTALAFGFMEVFGEKQGDAAKMQLDTIKMGLDGYYLSHQEYPDSLQVLVDEGKLEEKQLKDPWKQDIVYRLTGPKTYEICSGGEDGSIGGQDDICVVRESKRRN
ncbi:MAG: prepilin-type N-terminal cleavage/methylation domain-containing protein [Deltaproteobacteria bacterium]|nr:MAG: prepilin-type N-terminal cleavage/methylation domain-containing protein [Deltaproteobacteria bacterium]